MRSPYKARRLIVMLVTVTAMFLVAGLFTSGPPSFEQVYDNTITSIKDFIYTDDEQDIQGDVVNVLETIPVKGKAPKTGYERSQFSDGWGAIDGCDQRNNILRRDLTNITFDSDCKVISGILEDPYTGKTINFQRGSGTSSKVQIDHVVALSNAWQTGAQQLSYVQRNKLANDPLELMAVDGSANQKKSAGDAATWLPENKSFRCQYVARQVAVKKKYSLWVTEAEKQAILRVLNKCPNQKLPVK